MTSSSILHNIRVLDFTWVLAGPYATRLWADFGAEVIKVQPLMPEADSKFARGYYNMWNRNKLGITLNLSKPEGVALAKRLVSISDAVIENFTPRVMANWGLDYGSLKQVKPDIIMLSLSVMGQSGPWRDYTGFGPTIQAFSGMTYLTSFPGKSPTGLGFSYADHVAGLYASLALLAAFEYKRKTGEGQYIDISEVETMASLLSEAILDYSASGNEPMPVGNDSPGAAPHNVYRCRSDDRWCAIAVFSDEEWQAFKRALGNPSWTEDERFATLAGRRTNSEELDRQIAGWTSQRTAEEVMSVLQKFGVRAGLVQNAHDLANNHQLRERGFFIELKHREPGKTVADATPIKLSSTPAIYHRAAPASGQDNDYVYKQLLGLSEAEVARLRTSEVI